MLKFNLNICRCLQAVRYKMPKKFILFTRPNYDTPTSVLHYFSEVLIKSIKEVGEYNIINLEGPKATKIDFEKVIAKSNPRMVVLNGHGSKSAIFGNNEEILNKDNIHLLKSKIVYAVACDSSEELGEIAIGTGKADAYIGYEAYFMVVIDPSRSSTPSKDKNLKVFIKPYATLILSLVSGLSVETAIDKTKDVLKSLIREYGVYGTIDNYGDAPLIRFGLYWDLTFLKGYGNLKTTI